MIAADIAMLEAVITGKVGGGPTAAVSDGVVIVSAFSGSSTSGEKTMRTEPAAPKDIDQYIARFPPDVQKTLETVRRTIRKAAPDAEETIKYQIPTFTLHGNLVHFAAYKTHIGFTQRHEETRSSSISSRVMKAERVR